MKLGARQRWLVLIVLLTLTLSAAAWIRESGKASYTEVVESPVRLIRTIAAVAPTQQEQPSDRVHLDKMRIRAGTGQGKNAFAPHSWRKNVPKAPVPVVPPVIVKPPPPQQVAVPAPATPVRALPEPPPPPPPTAPPLPFVYMGKILSEETNAIFLTMGERNLIVHEGDVIDTTYLVEKISSADLTFVHIPTGIQQTLIVDGPQAPPATLEEPR